MSDSAQPAAATPETQLSLRGLFREHRGRMVFTYALFNVENLLRLAQPWAIGWAINDLLNKSWTGVYVLIGQHLSYLVIGSFRQMYDTRTFTAIYSNLASRVIADQREHDEPVSKIAARSALSREYVDFFENSVPMILRSSYSIVGALLMLGWYDPWLIVYCGGLLVPAFLLNRVYSRVTRRLAGGLHDQLEHEVDVITHADSAGVNEHFRKVAGWRIKLSDAEAINFSLMELFVLGVIVASLVRYCSNPDVTPGDIFAVFRYLLMFLMGMDAIPKLVQQFSRLRDIGTRTGRRGRKPEIRMSNQ